MTRRRDVQATAILAAAGAFHAAMADEVLAGEVTVRRAGRNLFIEGGDTLDVVTLTAGGDGMLRIQAGESTTLQSGQSSVDVPVGRRDRVTVALGGADAGMADVLQVIGSLPAMKELRVLIGDDDPYASVFVSGAFIPGDLRVDSSDAQDGGTFMYMQNSRVSGRLTLDGGTSGDTLQSHSCTLDGGARVGFRSPDAETPRGYFYSQGSRYDGDLIVSGRDGRDVFAMNGTTVSGDVDVSLGDGPDYADLTQCSIAGKTTLKMGRDDAADVMNLRTTSFAGKLTIDSGEAGTTLEASSCTIAGGAKITSRGGGDSVWLRGGVVSGKPVKILAGDGGDMIQVTYDGMSPVSIQSPLVVDGGEGTDTLDAGGASPIGAGSLSKVSIESEVSW